MGARGPADSVARRADPFDLDDDAAYLRWRADKLARYPARVAALTVAVADPRALTATERAALLDRIARANTAVYRSPVRDADKDLPRLLGAQLGLRRLDANWLADEDGISQVTVAPAAAAGAGAGERAEAGSAGAANGAAGAGRSDYIPYTTRPLRWHTDGYYHPAQRRIHGMILHCVRPAASGGENGLLDPEMAYITLRDADPGHVRALMQPDVMTIPARAADVGEGDGDSEARPAQTGPVFSVDAADGSLHMRYTARTRSIEWKPDASTRAALACLEALLAGASPWILRIRLDAGMGIVGHNVLHDRSGFDDDAERPRLLYRARYLDRVDFSPEAAWRNG